MYTQVLAKSIGQLEINYKFQIICGNIYKNVYSKILISSIFVGGFFPFAFKILNTTKTISDKYCTCISCWRKDKNILMYRCSYFINGSGIPAFLSEIGSLKFYIIYSITNHDFQ
jgi:hypothetical protein